MKWEVELKDFGRDDHCSKTIIEKPILDEVHNWALEECSKYLLSSEINLGAMINAKKGEYEVLVGGWRVIGKVFIKRIEVED